MEEDFDTYEVSFTVKIFKGCLVEKEDLKEFVEYRLENPSGKNKMLNINNLKVEIIK